MRRRESSGNRPPIPNCFRKFRIDAWWDDGPPSRDDNEAIERGIDAYRRWCRARDAWAEQHGYTRSEMWHAQERHSCANCPPPDAA